jgi:adenine phosphoribosyltransferase
MTALRLLRESLVEAPVIKRGGYEYFIHPLTDSIPIIQPELMKEVCESIMGHADLDVDFIVTMEAMGIHLAAVLSQLTGLPFNIIRKRPYGLPGEVTLHQETGYSSGAMYLNNVEEGYVVTVVDAVVSTGGTLTAVINGLLEAGAVVKDVVCVIGRGDGAREVEEATGYQVKTLVEIDVVGDRVVILSQID